MIFKFIFSGPADGGILSVAVVLDAVYEHLNADKPMPDVHRPGGVDGGGDDALVQAQVVDSAVGSGQVDHLVHGEVSGMLLQTLIQSMLQPCEVFCLDIKFFIVLSSGVCLMWLQHVFSEEDDSLVLSCWETERVILDHIMLLH